MTQPWSPWFVATTSYVPRPDEVLEAGDELLFVSGSSAEPSVRAAIYGAQPLRIPERP